LIYIISHFIPYEGMSEAFQGTKEECLDWYNKYNRYYNIQDLVVYIEGPDAEQFFKVE
jgi:hypothetical protein